MTLSLLRTAAALAARSLDWLETNPQVSSGQLENLWRTFGQLQTHWQRALRFGPLDQHPSLILTISISSCLTHVGGALLVAHDDLELSPQTADLGRYFLRGHQELQRRARNLTQSLAADQQLALRDRTTQMERWTDVLTGQLIARHHVLEFAPQPERALEFGLDDLQCRAEGRLQSLWALRWTACERGFTGVELHPASLAQLREYQEAWLALLGETASSLSGSPLWVPARTPSKAAPPRLQPSRVLRFTRPTARPNDRAASESER